MIISVPERLTQALRTARQVTVLTGSGISAESGIPTFRDAQTGLWAKYRPEDLATMEAFSRDPKLVWDWYLWRRSLVEHASPNPGHEALVAMEQKVPEFTLITQNIDGLHRRAGNRHVVELHGNLNRARCIKEQTVVELPPELDEVPPRCQECGSLLRPDVVWFGEPLPADALAQAEHASRHCELFFCIGTSVLVYPAAGLPYRALQAGALVVEVNPAMTPLTPYVHIALQASAAQVLPGIIAAVWGSSE